MAINKLSISHINRELKHNLALMIATAHAQRSSFWDTRRPGCFQKENAYLLGALEIIRLVEEAMENYYKLSQGCFPLAALRHVSGKRPKWISIENFNQDHVDYFKRNMEAIVTPFISHRLCR